MSAPSKIARIIVVLFSLSLLAAYVWHSHVTPNIPPPDPFGLHGIDLELEPEVIEFEGFINYGNQSHRHDQAGSELRVISSKVINQPVFSVRRVRLPWETDRVSWNRRKGDPFCDKPDIKFEGFGIKISGFARK